MNELNVYSGLCFSDKYTNKQLCMKTKIKNNICKVKEVLQQFSQFVCLANIKMCIKRGARKIKSAHCNLSF